MGGRGCRREEAGLVLSYRDVSVKGSMLKVERRAELGIFRVIHAFCAVLLA